MLEVALRIAFSHDWHHELDYNRDFYDEGRFDYANTRTEQAKLHAVNNVLQFVREVAWVAVMIEECRDLLSGIRGGTKEPTTNDG